MTPLFYLLMLLSIAFLGFTIFGYFAERRCEKSARLNAVLALIAWVLMALIDLIFYIGGAFNE